MLSGLILKHKQMSPRLCMHQLNKAREVLSKPKRPYCAC